MFGVSKDVEGRIYINPQSWALMSGAADQEKQEKLIRAVEEQLETPYGVRNSRRPLQRCGRCRSSYARNIPGSAENGAVYNHAAAFYIYALYLVGEKEKAYRLLRKIIPGPDAEDILQRGRYPIIPNYYAEPIVNSHVQLGAQSSVQHRHGAVGISLSDRRIVWTAGSCTRA